MRAVSYPEELWSEVMPGLDCLVRKHLWVSLKQEGAFPTRDGRTPRATWCLWCGGGVSNEKLPCDD